MLLYLLLFWGIFLPLGARFSVDSALNESARAAPNRYFSMATLALLVQAMCVYTFGALLKTGVAWIPQGTAVYYALNIDYLVTPFAVWFRQFPDMLQFLTYFVWSLELLAPILMFSPIATVRVRLFGMVLLIAMHVGFLLCLYIGIFPFASITSILAFTPGVVWDRIGARIRTPKRRGVTIYYDEPCGFCRKVCLILRSFLLLPDTPILPAQSVPAILAEMREHNSWVVVDYDGSHHVRFDAIVVVFRRSVLFRPFAPLFAMAWARRMGERIYETIARNRGALGRWSAVTLPYRDVSIVPSAAAQWVVGVLIAMVLVVNLQSVHRAPAKLAALADEVTGTLRLGQSWLMFAPFPSRLDGWFVVRGTTVEGQPVDVLRDRVGEPEWTRPRLLADTHPTYRWERYRMFLMNDRNAKYRPYYAQYLCRQWNRDPAHAKIASVEIYFNREYVPRDYLSRHTERVLVDRETCR
jgi:hypothetical protein